jgi:selenocysteine lyase/cysteine desulfurase
MSDRRTFLRKSLGFTGALSLSSFSSKETSEHISDALMALKKLNAIQAASDDDLWARIAKAFTTNDEILNLNNGGVSPQPKIVQDAVDQYYHLSNQAPTYFMWRVLDKGRETIRKSLADLAGASKEEVCINRNTTESLATVTWGLSLTRGDEIVMTRHDYPNMIQAWKQKELRDGIKINWVDLELAIENEDLIVNKFINSTTSKTKVWHITHMISWTGQILPVRRLCDEARKRNIISIIDGAHTFAHIDFRISDFTPDYFGTSLHKWLCAPFGTGMLYVKKENIQGLWPLFPNDKPQSDDIRKFEVLGTRSSPSEQGITQAIDFHNAIGIKKKEERLRYLKNYWCEKLKTTSRIGINVSLKPEFSCGIGNFSIEGMDAEAISLRLWTDHKIHTTTIKLENLNGVRVTPHIYTTLKDLDRFAEAVIKIAAE